MSSPSPAISPSEQLGVKLGKLTDTSFFVQADTGTGSVSVTQNDITVETDGTVSTVPQSKVRGDANCDGVLDVSDAVLTARVLVEDIEAEITQQGLKNADANGSGKLESEDLSMLLQAIAKKIKL